MVILKAKCKNIPKSFKSVNILQIHLINSNYILQGNASVSSSRCSTPTLAQQVTKVTATAKFKVEVHTPAAGTLATGSAHGGPGSEPPTRPASSRSRRSASSASSSVHSSLSDSLRSSLSSNDGDAGFSEK